MSWVEYRARFVMHTCTHNSYRKSVRKNLVESPRNRWEDVTEICLWEVSFEGMIPIELPVEDIFMVTIYLGVT
jgi:hypothetical protein